MAYVLNALSLASHGLVSPTKSGFCLAPFPLASHGIILPRGQLPADDKLADPTTRPAGWEPFDISYYRWKYRKTQRDEPQDEPQPERPNLMPQLLERDDLAAKIAQAEARGAEMERDIIELQAYIAEVETGIETGIAAQVAAQELELERQEELMQRLRDNVILAREALLVALEARRRHQNQLAAIEAVIRIYY